MFSVFSRLIKSFVSMQSGIKRSENCIARTNKLENEMQNLKILIKIWNRKKNLSLIRHKLQQKFATVKITKTVL